MVQRDGGRLLHMSGLQIEKACLPNWVQARCIAATLVVVEQSCHCESVELNTMRPAKYDGQR